jgi:ATP-dependent helicase/nuclease subunit B
VSTFSLEADALVSPSGLLDDLAGAGLAAVVEPAPSRRIFEHEALMLATPAVDHLEPAVAAWARHRAAGVDRRDPRFRGYTGAHRPPAFALSGLERYQDCPFRFFASHVLGLDEAPDDGSALSPRARGRFLHEVFQRFFEAWDREGGGALAPEQVDRARALCAAVAEPLLGRLPDADASLERQRLFGSAISVGAVDVVLAVEASRHEPVGERWLEYRLEGEFSLGLDDGRRVPLKGVADRVDLLPGRRLRVIDYKSGSAPAAARALQAPVYALCARERLEARDGRPWLVDEAAYVALSGRRRYVPVVRSAADGAGALAAARSRLLAAIDGISRGEFPVRPHDPLLCRACSFTSVCRKDDTADV